MNEPTTHGNSPVDMLMAKLRSRVDDDGNVKPRPDPDEPPAEDTPPPAAVTDKPEGDEPAADPEPTKKPDGRLELKLAKTMQELTKAQAAEVTLKKERDAHKAELDGLKGKLKNPLAVFKMLEDATGKPFHELMTAAAKGEFDPGPQLPPEIADRLAKLEEREAAQSAREAEQKRIADEQAEQNRLAATRKTDIESATKFLVAHEDKYGWAAAVGLGPEHIVNAAYEVMQGGGQPDMDDIAKDVNASVRGHLLEILQNDKLTKLLASDTELVQLANRILGGPSGKSSSAGSGAKPKPAASNGSTAQALTSEVPTRSEREWTRDEEKAESVRLLRQVIRTGTL